jgi:nucleotide-binding universal stress UspA family protein
LSRTLNDDDSEEACIMYKNILVPVDGSDASNRGLAEAVKLAKGAGGSLLLVHVVNEHIMDYGYELTTFDGRLIDSLREGGRKVLNTAQQYVTAQGARAETAMPEAIGARAADLILAEAKQWPADLIVMGTHGRRGVRRLLMGSDAEQVVRMASMPVLLVRGAGE